ncbi:hypothetical protein PHLCEN_2v4489 [Hermanssonia centrifuga]|uniref:Uncharacterized protein n=1 Tax=Hermanssonia centrifuga TaxID=98765 RepID=A0A2R6PP07_9APHY|nr:hypothetical protein PHLCEN_2v4489 [Hermanssonia centrifuga]
MPNEGSLSQREIVEDIKTNVVVQKDVVCFNGRTEAIDPLSKLEGRMLSRPQWELVTRLLDIGVPHGNKDENVRPAEMTEKGGNDALQD